MSKPKNDIRKLRVSITLVDPVNGDMHVTYDILLRYLAAARYPRHTVESIADELYMRLMDAAGVQL